jgi:hypothetical protein
MAYRGRRIRTRALVRNTQDGTGPPIVRNLFGDSPDPSLRVPTPPEGPPRLFLPAVIARQESSGRSSPSIQEVPRTLGGLRITNLAPGDLTSGDESSIIYRTASHPGTMTGEAGSSRSAAQGPRQIPPPLEGDNLAQSLPSSSQARRTPPGVMENTPGIGPRDLNEAEPQDPIVYEHPPQDRRVALLRSNLFAALGADTGDRPPRSLSSDESDIPLDTMKSRSSQPPSGLELDVNVYLPAAAEQLQPSNDAVRQPGGSSNRELGGDPEDRVRPPNVSQSSLVISGSQITEMTPMQTEESHAPPEDNAAPVDMARSPSPVESPPGDLEDRVCSPSLSRSSPTVSDSHIIGMASMQTEESLGRPADTARSPSLGNTHASQGSTSSAYSSESEAATASNLRNYPYGFMPDQTFSSNDDVPKPLTNRMQQGHSKTLVRKRGRPRKRSKPKSIQREPSSASY